MMDVCVFRFCDVTAAERLRSGWTRGGIHTNRASGYAGRDTDRYTHTHTHTRTHTYTHTYTTPHMHLSHPYVGLVMAHKACTHTNTHTHIHTYTHTYTTHHMHL